MAKVDVLDLSGTKVGSRDLLAEIFEAEVRRPLMHQVMVAGLASIRAGTQSTKTRGEVSGGGKKPWRQKGTGRARQGSIRSPQWVGGGVAQGPKPRSYAMRVNKKMKRGALRGGLTDAVRSGKVVVVEALSLDEPKTNKAAELLSTLDLAGRVLVVLPEPSTGLAVEKSFRNIPHARVSYTGALGVYEILQADRILFTAAALDALQGESARDANIEEEGAK